MAPPAFSSCAHAGAAAQYAGHSCTCPTSHAQRVGSGILARIAYGCWHICRDTQDASVQVTGLAAVLSKLMLMFCAEHILQLALQHTCNAGTHAMQHILWADAMLLWICTHTCKSGDGMDTVL